MINFDFNDDVGLTIKIPASNANGNGNLIKPLASKELASAIAEELVKEGMTEIKSLGVYVLNLKIWIVKET